MKQYSTISNKMRRFTSIALTMFLGFLATQQVLAQCNNPSQFGTITAPTNNTPVTITTCAFGGEYSTINSATAGSTYLFSATGGAGNYLTVRQGTPGGAVLGFGFSPVSVVCTVSGPLYLHYNINAACGTDGSCHTGVVQCTSCPGAPDPCLSIAPITCGTPTTATLSGSGLWSPGACGFSTPGTEKLYSFTATATGVHNLQVTSTNSGGFIDYFVKAASGGCNATGWTCIDDIFSPVTASMGTLTAGTTYYILLDPETSASVVHTFQINCPSSVPSNDACANATPIACGGSASGSTVGANNDGPAADCGGGSTAPDVWYTITGTGGAITASLCGGGTNYDSQLDVYTGACGALTNIGGCNDDFCGLQSQMTWTSTLGVVYRIRVHGFSGSTGNFSLAVTCAPPPGPANDNCANATPIACGGSASGSTVLATNDGPATDCGSGSTAPDVWYTIVGNGSPITASLCGSSYDTQIDVYTGACGALTNIGGCNDDFCGLQSQMTWTSTLGVVYSIRVHGFGGSTGNFTLAVTCLAAPPPCLALPTSPTNGQANLCPVATNLSWPASAGATSYDVYFGTTAVPPFVANVINTNYNAGTLAPGSYFWRIAPRNSTGPNSGCITWTFTVATGAFTVPPFGASTVACPALIVQPPPPPAVTTNCGSVVTPTGPTITNNPNPITCEGTRTFTWTYNNGFGQVTPWTHVVTVERNPFSVPAGGSATVSCPDQTDAQPTPPVVTSNCGEVLLPVITSSPKPGCAGGRVWSFSYTDCEGNTATWVFIYTVVYPNYTVPANEVVSAECPLVIVVPTPPSVIDACGKTLNPSGPVITGTNNATGCEASRKYTWTYSDCTGNTKTWSKTFNFAYTADFFVYPDGEINVGCLLYAQTGPVPPTIYGICGEEIGYSGPTITESIDPSGCSGTRKFTFIYTDCGGHSRPWSFTYIAADNEPPVGNCSIVSDVTNLACIEDVPCPGDYDFGPKIQEMIASGNIYDLCSGSDINVDLDSWSVLWQCSDVNGDGINTFGRTFYFRVSDQCGNEMPSLCGITYSGKCLPLETFYQSEWGNEGNEPGTSTTTAATDLQTITALLATAPLTIGGSNRSLTLTDAQCLMDLVPGAGSPTILSNCIQTNCNGCNPTGPIGMKNSLATNTISMMLNMRYNVLYNNLLMVNIRNQSLACLDIDPNIKACGEGVACMLHLFEMDGTEHEFPYTMGGLYDLANLYLDGNLVMSPGNKLVYANAINNSISTVNAYWHSGETPTSCPPNAGLPFAGDDSSNKALSIGKPSVSGENGFSLAPNPASNEVTFQLMEIPEAQDIVFEVYNSLGQSVLRRSFGKVSSVNERISLNGIGSGLYIVNVKAGGVRYEQKLVVGK